MTRSQFCASDNTLDFNGALFPISAGAIPAVERGPGQLTATMPVAL